MALGHHRVYHVHAQEWWRWASQQSGCSATLPPRQPEIHRAVVALRSRVVRLLHVIFVKLVHLYLHQQVRCSDTTSRPGLHLCANCFADLYQMITSVDIPLVTCVNLALSLSDSIYGCCLLSAPGRRSRSHCKHGEKTRASSHGS